MDSAFSSKPEPITDSHQNRTIIRGDGNIGGNKYDININSQNCKN
jgi:hypothetical protein